MPFMMEDSMGGTMQVDLHDVDDLFGDVTLPARAPSKRLLLRLDELRGRGSCQGLAWSKSGTIASISPDGQSLDLRYLRAHPKDATWSLSEPTSCTPWQGPLVGPLAHLSWAPTPNPQLAVIDSVGRVLILNFSPNLNRPSTARRWETDAVDDLNAIVGTYWLNTMPAHKGMANPLHAPAVKHGNGYTYEPSMLISNMPFHPNPSQSALLCVTASGMLKMFWTQNTNKIEETTLELDSVVSADDLVTHAALCSDSRSKSIIVALATASKQLQVVRVVLNWNNPPPQESMKGIPSASQPLSPTLNERLVAVSTWLPGGGSESHLDPCMTQLSHIELLPTMMDQVNRTWLAPVILTVRSFVPTPETPYNQEVQSIIDRWEIVIDQPQTVHSAFEQLGSRRNSVGSQPQAFTKLKKLDTIIMNKIIIGIEVVRMGTVVAFMFSDGAVEYRDRVTMNEVWNAVNLDRINSIYEAGFVQSGGETPCLQTALSPTNFSLVQLGEDGKIQWHGVNYTLGDVSALDDAQHSAVIAALTLSAAQAATSHSNIDDILAVGRRFTHSHRIFAVDWVTEMVKMMRIAVDYSEEAPHDNLVRNNMLQLCLSTLNHLGWRGEYQPRTFHSKLSMLALNLRNIVILITIASNGPGIAKDRSPLDEPEVVDALAGCCKWSMDLLCWLADSLFCLLDDNKFLELLNQQRFSEVTPYLVGRNDVALHMVLSSATRGLISAVCRRIIHLNNLSQRAIQYYESRGAGSTNEASSKGSGALMSLYHAYQKILGYTSTSLIKVQEFDRLLSTLGADIRKSYSSSFANLANAPQQHQNQNNNTPKPDPGEVRIKRAQTACELTLLLAGQPPYPTFLPVVNKFFKEDLAEFRKHTDRAALFFGDYELLEIDDESRALAQRRQKGVRVDMFKRVEIFGRKHSSVPEELPLRRCARCASVMEDIAMVSNKPGINFVLTQQRNCCCGGRLAVLTRGELVG
ncbi:RNA polymerase II mediator complex subunit Sin4 [Pseudomassariella vexata]|uniref:Mediator of RNA polymerase II transcription subunit 16 n=1 Tax=Pseudomassariella vexata TaxID=1141098 RepID=A0A1Y2DS43_9PEZI|nr:RNA polymerase II mediator complex subunit Sin4 [Pseudomassariella vexata]ORY62102.1 RNA polymerase II mediator complex subunit Sin4 [Pseudomassariella vexata]